MRGHYNIALGLFAGAVGIAGGCLVVLLPTVAAPLCIVIALLLVLLGLRSHIPRVPRLDITSTDPDKDCDDGAYRTPRRLVYAGLLSSCLLKLRAHGVTLSDAFFLLAFAMAYFESVDRRDYLPVLSGKLWLGIELFALGGLISTLYYSTDKLSSVGVIARVFYLVVAWFWCGGKSLRTREHLWTALKLWVVSAAICGFWAIGQKYAGLPASGDTGRVAGLADHVNDLGALAGCAIVPALVLTWRDSRWGLAALGITIGLVLSGSIGGGIAALVAVAFGLLAPDLTKPVLVALTVGAIGLLLASPLIGATAITRFATSTNSSSPSSQDTFVTRTQTYALAWGRIKQDPLIGTGFGLKSSEIFDPIDGNYYQVHNLLLASWFGGGIFAFLGILILEATLLSAAWRQVNVGKDKLLALVLLAAFLAYLIAEMSEPAIYKRYSLVPALLIVALGYQSNRLALDFRTRSAPWVFGGDRGGDRLAGEPGVVDVDEVGV